MEIRSSQVVIMLKSHDSQLQDARSTREAEMSTVSFINRHGFAACALAEEVSYRDNLDASRSHYRVYMKY